MDSDGTERKCSVSLALKKTGIFPWISCKWVYFSKCNKHRSNELSAKYAFHKNEVQSYYKVH